MIGYLASVYYRNHAIRNYLYALCLLSIIFLQLRVHSLLPSWPRSTLRILIRAIMKMKRTTLMRVMMSIKPSSLLTTPRELLELAQALPSALSRASSVQPRLFCVVLLAKLLNPVAGTLSFTILIKTTNFP